MKFLFKIFIYLVIFILSLLVFSPKEGLYNLAQEHLQKQNIIISDEKIDSKAFGLNINDAKIYFEGINVGKVEAIKLNTFLLFNSLSISNIELLDSFEKMAPTPIEKIEIIYSVLDIKNVKISGESIYGNLEGYIDIFNQKVYLEFEANEKMKRDYSNLLRMMKLKDGRYIYEYNY